MALEEHFPDDGTVTVEWKVSEVEGLGGCPGPFEPRKNSSVDLQWLSYETYRTNSKWNSPSRIRHHRTQHRRLTLTAGSAAVIDCG